MPYNILLEINPFRLTESVCPPLPAEVADSMIPSDRYLPADQEGLNNTETSSWAAFHAQREEYLNKFKENRSALLPIWHDDSKSLATIKHVLKQLKKAVQHINPSQPNVTTLNQPLHAIRKKLQWILEKFEQQNLYLFWDRCTLKWLWSACLVIGWRIVVSCISSHLL